MNKKEREEYLRDGGKFDKRGTIREDYFNSVSAVDHHLYGFFIDNLKYHQIVSHILAVVPVRIGLKTKQAPKLVSVYIDAQGEDCFFYHDNNEAIYDLYEYKQMTPAVPGMFLVMCNNYYDETEDILLGICEPGCVMSEEELFFQWLEEVKLSADEMVEKAEEQFVKMPEHPSIQEDKVVCERCYSHGQCKCHKKEKKPGDTFKSKMNELTPENYSTVSTMANEKYQTIIKNLPNVYITDKSKKHLYDALFKETIQEVSDKFEYDEDLSDEPTPKELAASEAELEKRVHQTHCCKEHGCKYGDVDCQVVEGKVKQLYPCEECEDAKFNPCEESVKEHEANCCVIHGCHYNDTDCPVAKGRVEQLADNCSKCMSESWIDEDNNDDDEDSWEQYDEADKDGNEEEFDVYKQNSKTYDHQELCCQKHGCKIGKDNDCPVFNGQVEQLSNCGECWEGV